MDIRAASKHDLADMLALVTASGLPAGACGEHRCEYFVAEEHGRIIAVGGLQECGPVGLLRSLAVAPAHRGRGIAAAIVGRIETRALELGMGRVYLLTETASKYFERLDYAVCARTDLPAPIRGTKQFREICPESATAMCKTLT